MQVFTTTEAGKVCGVSGRTIAKWFDAGRLKGYRLPGSSDRRIPRQALEQFLRDNGMAELLANLPATNEDT